MLAASLVLGLSSFAIQYNAARPVHLDAAISEFAVLPVKFIVLELPRTFPKTQGSTAAIRIIQASMSELPNDTHSLSARGLLRGGEELKGLSPNATYSCSMELRSAPRQDRAGFFGSCKSEVLQLSEPPHANQLVQKMRTAFMQNLVGVSEDAAGLVAGLAIGDTTQISSNLQQNMKSVSLTHLTAVSGANCAIVLMMFYLLVRKLGGGRKTRLVVGLIALIGYVLLVGPQPSVLRAAVMAGAVLIGISLGRKSGALNALGLSIIVLLIADPWLAIDFGFALSVAATLGLLLFTQPMKNLLAKYLPNWLAIGLAVTMAAQLMCLPILLQLQSGLATYSIPANLLAESLVPPITVLGITACLVAWVMPWAAVPLNFVASLFSWLVCLIANYFAGLPNTTLSWPTGIFGALLAVCLTLAVLLWLKAEPTNLKNIGLAAISLIAASSIGSIGFTLMKSANWPLKNWSIVACDVDQGDGFVIQSAGKIAVIDVGRDDKYIDACLSRLNVNVIDLLILTHFDMDHIGGLRGAIEGRKVNLAMVSPFKDQRWGATGTNQYLAESKIPIVVAEKNMSGQLGEVSWLVLSPLRAASGAEDSNDASIAILWQDANFNFLSMADTGERAQMRMAADLGWVNKVAESSVPLILKVAHHGSADQFGELIEALDPEVSIISAGKENSYGHPTDRTLKILESTGSSIVRTDRLGSIALAHEDGGLVLANSPRG
jgi:competence protein ComEC